MSPTLILIIIACYFLSLILIGYISSRKADESSYYIGNKKSIWYLVAFGMLSDSLSGVTYISVPGAVYHNSLTYFQVVIGYFIGYYIIAWVLLPLYYRMNLISIYSYLRSRFGINAQKTGSFYFLISRIFGAAGRLMLAIGVMQLFVFDALHIPFYATAALFILLMLIYTYRGGIKTLVFTDAFQSLFLIAGVVLSIVAITSQLDLNFSETIGIVRESSLSKMFEFDAMKSNFWAKHIVGGALFTVAMTGLDQNMMQKNLSMKSLGEARKNMVSFSFVLLIVNILFLSLGVLLYEYMTEMQISIPVDEAGKIFTDNVFPTLAMNHFGTFATIAFIIGLTAATFSSADSVLATLTTSYCIDFLGFDASDAEANKIHKNTRHKVHIAFSVILLLVIVFLKYTFSSKSTIDLILFMATLTYGPLLGLFAAGILTKWKIKDKWIPHICLISPLLSYLLYKYGSSFLGGYKFGNELILVNGLLTFLFLLLLKIKGNRPPESPQHN